MRSRSIHSATVTFTMSRGAVARTVDRAPEVAPRIPPCAQVRKMFRALR